MSRGNFNLQMTDLFPPLFGDEHHQHDPSDSRDYIHSSINHCNGSYFAASTSLPFELNEQYVEKDFNINSNNGFPENRGGVAGNDFGFRENYEGFVVENHYPNSSTVQNNYPNESTEDDSFRVLPCQSGEGLPYAPVDWPNPGDNWSWKVGKRFNNAYHFADRFIYAPKRLRKITKGPHRFASKPSVAKYILSHFPDADIDAFFASFTWKIPVNLQYAKKVQAISEVDQVDAINKVLEELKDEIPNAKVTKRKRKLANPVESEDDVSPYIVRKRKNSEVSWEREEETPYSTGRKQDWMEAGLDEFEEDTYYSSSQRQGKQRSAISSSSREPKSRQKSYRVSSSRSKQKSRYSQFEHMMEGKSVVYIQDEEPPSDDDDFDKYLNTLEDIITQPTEYNSINVVPFFEEDEMAEARSRLSSLLAMDFPSLVTPEIISEVTTLASKLQRDPTITAEQLVKLKLLEDISSYAEVFLESREVIEEVNNLFAALEANKQKVYSQKNEYKELKGKAREHQKYINSGSSAIERIDHRIAQLQSRRSKLSNSIENKNAAKTEVTHCQKIVAAEIPTLVCDIQAVNSEMAELKQKRANAVTREAEIRKRFKVLKGFSL